MPKCHTIYLCNNLQCVFECNSLETWYASSQTVFWESDEILGRFCVISVQCSPDWEIIHAPTRTLLQQAAVIFMRRLFLTPGNFLLSLCHFTTPLNVVMGLILPLLRVYKCYAPLNKNCRNMALIVRKTNPLQFSRRLMIFPSRLIC